jgi:hypothetical protein
LLIPLTHPPPHRRFDDSAYSGQRDALAIAVALVIVFGVVYVLAVFAIEVYNAAGGGQRSRKKAKAASASKGGEGGAGGPGDSSVRMGPTFQVVWRGSAPPVMVFTALSPCTPRIVVTPHAHTRACAHSRRTLAHAPTPPPLLSSYPPPPHTHTRSRWYLPRVVAPPLRTGPPPP